MGSGSIPITTAVGSDPPAAQGEQVIRERGFDRSWLTCSSFNPRALEFYRRRGYRIFESRWKRHECGIDEESFAMERMLTVSA